MIYPSVSEWLRSRVSAKNVVNFEILQLQKKNTHTDYPNSSTVDVKEVYPPVLLPKWSWGCPSILFRILMAWQRRLSTRHPHTWGEGKKWWLRPCERRRVSNHFLNIAEPLPCEQPPSRTISQMLLWWRLNEWKRAPRPSVIIYKTSLATSWQHAWKNKPIAFDRKCI